MNIKLTELEPCFHSISPDDPKIWRRVDSLEKAQGIMFLCPKCFKQHGGKIGTHSVVCWFKDRGVPDDMDPKPGRWNPSGTGFEDLTFVGPGATSVLLTSGCCWHGHIQNGEATDCG